jgi:hypothetical protein
VYGQVDAAGQHRFVDFLAEQPLAADLMERPVLNPVAGGTDHYHLEGGRFGEGWQRRRDTCAHDLGLRQRQRTAARADPDAAAAHR